MLLKSEVNSPENSGEADEEDDLSLQGLDQDFNMLSYRSRGGSTYSDGGDDCCTSECATPCRNPRHIEARVASEIMG